MAVEIYLVKMSDHMESGEIIQWLVREGDRVEAGQGVLEIQTDKAIGEVEAPAAGILKGIRAGVEDGAIVPVGVTLAFIAEPDEAVPHLEPLDRAVKQGQQGTVRHALPAPGPALASLPQTSADQNTPDKIPAAPAARRLAKELGIELARIHGTGPGGRVTTDDVRNFMNSIAADDDAEWLELNAFQRTTASRMTDSLRTVPQFSLSVDVDMTNALRFRQTALESETAGAGERPTITALLVHCAATALRQHPRINASYTDGRLRLHRAININVAVGTRDGLAAPVIRDADQLSLADITRTLRTFRDNAQAMRFNADELMGGTFTISNLGMFGIDRFNAMVTPPQCAVLAAGRIVQQPAGMPDNTMGLRPIMNLTLTVDHRCVDGVQAAECLNDIRRRLAEMDPSPFAESR